MNAPALAVKAAIGSGLQNLTVKAYGYRDKELKVSETSGLIFENFHAGATLTMVLNMWVNPKLRFLAVKIDNRTHEVTEIKPETKTDSRLQFVVPVKIVAAGNGVPYPTSDSNIIRIVTIDSEGGCAMWNIAIIAQNGRFFVTKQMMCAEQAYFDGTTVVVPGLLSVNKSTKLSTFIGSYIDGLPETDNIHTPPVSEYVPVEKTVSALGEVIWYSQHAQTGAIQTEQGAAKIHFSNIQTKGLDGLKSLREGDKVTYKLEEIPANRRTDFQFEAKNVTLQ